MKRLMALVAGATLVVGALGSTEAVRAGAESDQDGGPTPSLPTTVEPSATDGYIVVMKDKPLIDTIGHDQLGTPAADAPAAALEASHDDVLSEEGLPPEAKVDDYVNGINGFAVTASFDQARQLAANSNVAAVLPDELQQLTGSGSSGGGGGGGDPGGGPSTGVSGNDDLPKFLGLTKTGGAWKSGITGEGVRIGVIDSGIWPEHPSFASSAPIADPLPGPVQESCDFGSGTGPTAYPDVAFTCNNKLVGARQEMANYKARFPLDPDEYDSARDNDGHGTHVASTAAGNADVQAQLFGVDYGTVSGIAPSAQVVAYKVAGHRGALTSDVAAAVDQAIADGVDVINLSIGSSSTNLLQPNLAALLSATDAGIFVATSVGNAGPTAGTIGGAAAVPWTTAVGATTQERVFQGTVTLGLDRFGWGPNRGEGLTLEGSSVTSGTNGAVDLVDGAAAGGEECLPGQLNPALVTGKVVLCLLAPSTGPTDPSSSPADKSAEVKRAGGVGLIAYNQAYDQDLYSDNAYLPTVNVESWEGQMLKTYLQSAQRPKVTLTVGGTWDWPNAPSMASFSSRGPNAAAADVVKPDLTAPGMQILAGDSPVSDPSVSAPGQLFQAISGSSMASPVVAGMFALLKQAHPDWTPAMAKSALMTTADTDVVDNDRQTQAGPFAMGAGFVDIGKVSEAGSAFDPGLVYDTGSLDYLGFICDAAPDWFALYGHGRTCATLPPEVSQDAVDLNAPSIGVAALPGSITVTRTVTNVAATATTWWSSVKAPAGYRVTVSPSTLTIAPGASARFKVSFVNDGTGQVGQWTTGSLTWTSGDDYKVRSAIAVRGSTFAAPASVADTGTSGSLGFSAQFGYTGPYSATAHGLTPRTLLPGTVKTGGVVAFPVVASGVGYARWTLKLPNGDLAAGDDLDMVLLDSTGKVVIAQSGNPGTDEQIDINGLPDGNYVLKVLGGAVADPNGSAFSVSQWLVPAAPSNGANLTVSAPDPGTLGTSANVAVTWQELTAGTEYLGTITHADATATLATTVVDITT